MKLRAFTLLSLMLNILLIVVLMVHFSEEDPDKVIWNHTHTLLMKCRIVGNYESAAAWISQLCSNEQKNFILKKFVSWADAKEYENGLIDIQQLLVSLGEHEKLRIIDSLKAAINTNNKNE